MSKLNEPFPCAESETGWAKKVRNTACYRDGSGEPCVYAKGLRLGEPCMIGNNCEDGYFFIPCDPPEKEEGSPLLTNPPLRTLAEALEVIERADGYLKNSQNTRGGCYCAPEGKCGLCILRDDVEAILKKSGRI